MNTESPAQIKTRSAMHSIWLQVAGFGLSFAAALLAVAGVLLAILGFGGHLLIRARPDSGRNINYDPGNIALLSPIPVFAGLVLMYVFLAIARRLGTNRR